MPAGRRLVESPGAREEHLAAGGHGVPPRTRLSCVPSMLGSLEVKVFYPT